MPNLLAARIAVALVWFYQGFWCKLLGRTPSHRNIAETVPLLNPMLARRALIGLGVFECFIAVWVVTGIQPSQGAAVQTLLVASMNAAGLLWARSLIPNAKGMLLQNLAFLGLVWFAAGRIGFHAGT